MRIRVIPGRRGKNQDAIIGLCMIAIVLAIVGWALPLVSTSDPTTSSQCLTGYFGNNATETNGTITLYCSQVGYTQLTGYPSPCPSNQYVFAIGVSLSCTTIQWANITNFPSGCPGGQFVTNIGSSITCATPPPDPNSSVKCTTGQFVTNVTEISGTFTIICSLVPWSSLTSFPSGCAAGSFVTAIGSTLTCGTPSQEASATAQCTSGQFAFNITEASGGSFTLGCSLISWSSLTNFPSGCGAGQFITAIGSTLTCATPAQEAASTAKCTTSGQLVTNVTESSAGAISLVCAYPDWTKLINFPSACSAEQYVSAVGVTLTCSAVGWTQLTGFPSACATGQFVTAVGSTLTCGPLDYLTNIYLYWKFNAGSGTTAIDSSGNGFTSQTISGTYVWNSCIINLCLADQSGDLQVKTPASGFTFPMSAFSMNFWFFDKTTGILGSNEMILYQPSSTGDGVIVYEETNDKIGLQVFYSGGSVLCDGDNTRMINEEWTMISLTFDGSTLSIYENGYLSKSCAFGTHTLLTAGNPMVLGSNRGGGGITGYIDDFRLYNAALTASQVQQIYQYFRMGNNP